MDPARFLGFFRKRPVKLEARCDSTLNFRRGISTLPPREPVSRFAPPALRICGCALALYALGASRPVDAQVLVFAPGARGAGQPRPVRGHLRDRSRHGDGARRARVRDLDERLGVQRGGALHRAALSRRDRRRVRAARLALLHGRRAHRFAQRPRQRGRRVSLRARQRQQRARRLRRSARCSRFRSATRSRSG